MYTALKAYVILKQSLKSSDGPTLVLVFLFLLGGGTWRPVREVRMSWIALGWLSGAHLAAPLPTYSTGQAENRIEKLMGWHKDRDIVYQQLSQAKQTSLGED